MPTPTTEIGRRLMRWQLGHTAPAPISIDHPVQADLAAAADQIERLRDALLTVKVNLQQATKTERTDAICEYIDTHLLD